MCLGTAYYIQGQSQEQILQDVAYIDLKGEQVRLVTLLGQEKLVDGRLLEVDLEQGSILLQPRSGA